jgi:hypothetical protein
VLKKLALTSATAITAAGLMLSATPANADVGASGEGNGLLSGNAILNNLNISSCGALIGPDCKGSGQLHQVDQSKR